VGSPELALQRTGSSRFSAVNCERWDIGDTMVGQSCAPILFKTAHGVVGAAQKNAGIQ
jgi:hypothetical protein